MSRVDSIPFGASGATGASGAAGAGTAGGARAHVPVRPGAVLRAMQATQAPEIGTAPPADGGSEVDDAHAPRPASEFLANFDSSEALESEATDAGRAPAGPETGSGTHVELERDGDRIRSIIVTCACGERTVLRCDYEV